MDSITMNKPSKMKATTKQTAVDWLVKQLDGERHLTEIEINRVIQQAKAMEREQISKAYVFGSAYGIDIKNGLYPNNYYNETYESND